MNTHGALIISKISDGGYLVRSHCEFPDARGYSSTMLYACTTIAEALAYIKTKMLDKDR